MKSLKTGRVAALLSTAALGAMVLPMTAAAEFAAPASQGFDSLLGDSTAGTETGVYELVPLITAAGLAIVTLTVIMVGIVFARKVVRKFTG